MESGISKAIKVMSAMRSSEKGCPWDRSQTHESLLPYLKEEAYEFIETLQTLGPKNTKTWEELGDLLFQVIFHAQLLEEAGLTHFDAIADQLAAKLIQRHPHVFDPKHPGFKTPDEVNLAWQELKAKARTSSPNEPLAREVPKALKDIPSGLGALQKAARMGEKMAAYGFDWSTPEEVWTKVEEEIGEYSRAQNSEEQKEELGDLFFALAQFARKKGWDPESILENANLKFKTRILKMDHMLHSQEHEWSHYSLTELEQLWQKSKAKNP